MPVSTTNLIYDLRVGTGETIVSGRLSAWTPAQGSIVADATQATAGLRPYSTTDPAGNPAIAFPWASGAGHPKCRLALPAGISITSDNCTVYVVAAVSAYEDQTIVQLGTAWPAGYLRMSASLDSPQRLAATVRFPATPVYVPINKAVYCVGSDASAGYVRLNNTTQATTAIPNIVLAGGTIGYDEAQTIEAFSGYLYRVLIYGTAHDATQRNAVVAALIADHSVTVGQTRRIVFEGDSLAAGVLAGTGVDSLKNFPNQAIYGNNAWVGYNVSTGSWKIGTAATANTIANEAAAQVDVLYDAGADQNVFCILAGTNDISSDGITGAQCFARLTDVLDARQVTGFDNWVVTIPDRSSNDTEVGDYNTLIRGGDSSIDRVIDVGKGSPSETRLNDSTNATYFDVGQVHLTYQGYGVIADAVFPTYDITGEPATATVGVESAAMLVTVTGATLFDGVSGGKVTITSSDAGAVINGYTTYPGTVRDTGTGAMIFDPGFGGASFYFTVTPSAAGTLTVTFTNDAGWTNPSNVVITVTAASSRANTLGIRLGISL